MLAAFLIDLDSTDYAMAAYGGQYGRYGEVTPRNVLFRVHEANLVKTVGMQSTVMALPIGGNLEPPPFIPNAYQAYVGDDFYA